MVPLERKKKEGRKRKLKKHEKISRMLHKNQGQ